MSRSKIELVQEYKREQAEARMTFLRAMFRGTHVIFVTDILIRLYMQRKGAYQKINGVCA